MNKSKTMLITGSLGALASDVANSLKDENFLVLVDLPKEPKNLKRRFKNYAYLSADISNGKEFAQKLQKLLGKKDLKVDGIVNTPAFIDFKKFSETDYGDMQKIVNTKLLGYANVIKATLNYLNSGSSIVNVASVHAHGTYEKYVMYAAANAGVIALTKALSIELRRKSRINVITPGGFITPLYKKFNPDWEEKLKKGQILRVDEITKLILFLLSDESSGINGAEIIADVGVSNLRAHSSDW